jgi:hypothetical protein
MGLLNIAAYGCMTGVRGVKVLLRKAPYLKGLGTFSNDLAKIFNETRIHAIAGQPHVITLDVWAGEYSLIADQPMELPLPVGQALKQAGATKVNLIVEANGHVSPAMLRFGLRTLIDRGPKLDSVEWLDVAPLGFVTGQKSIAIQPESPGVVNLTFRGSIFSNDEVDDASAD